MSRPTAHDTATARRAHTAAQGILADLAEPRRVRFRADYPPLRGRPASISGGAAGVALAHIEAARTGHATLDTAKVWLGRALTGPVNGGATATLWSGAPALGLVTAAAAFHMGLTGARQRLHQAAVRLTRHRLARAHARLARGELPPQAEFDLIQGLTGLGAYHLHTDPGSDITRQVLSYLTRLTQPITGFSRRLPGWWTDQSIAGVRDPAFPGGHLNLGVAHGAGALLAILSLALLRGVTVGGHTQAIERICAVLDTWQHTEQTGARWAPYYLTLRQWNGGSAPVAVSRQRPSWCYGTPGLARAHQLAGLAVDDPARQAMAVQAMADCLRDTSQLGTLTDLGLCHGWAGLLHCAWRINRDAPSAPLTADLEHTAAALLDRLDHDPSSDPEFLNGRAGIALALHAYANGTAPGVPWDACLALA
ncbi:hypothetical protein HNR12_005512 [Streptomonospora nanhaiensis]|uniref:Lanthionine synthetase n=1 Tax=Streptomonospora nanhaiensis TaxID=1323731 RepID=A0A853BWV3_9ACTN|nr:lanthionine synthetase C family protein [Streptomonospora nanhaiensis]NYI99235.1 hypothetical protein [Streptomonospora nanhaiensis]